MSKSNNMEMFGFFIAFTLWNISSLDIQEAESLIYWGYRAWQPNAKHSKGIGAFPPFPHLEPVALSIHPLCPVYNGMQY